MSLDFQDRSREGEAGADLAGQTEEQTECDGGGHAAAGAARQREAVNRPAARATQHSSKG